MVFLDRFPRRWRIFGSCAVLFPRTGVDEAGGCGQEGEVVADGFAGDGVGGGLFGLLYACFAVGWCGYAVEFGDGGGTSCGIRGFGCVLWGRSVDAGGSGADCAQVDEEADDCWAFDVYLIVSRM